MTWTRDLHPLVNQRDVVEAVRRATGTNPIALRQLPAIPPRAVFEASFESQAPVNLKAEVASPILPHDIALEGWALEHAFEAGVLVPRLLAADHTELHFPFRYLVMSRLEGESFERSKPKADVAKRVLNAAAEALALLHTIEIDGYGWLDEELYVSKGVVRGEADDWHAHTALQALMTLEQVTNASLVPESQADALSRRLRNLRAHQPRGRLIHGDFDSSQVFVRPNGTFSGIIDFGDRESGPREWDLSTFVLWDEEELLDDVLDGYEPTAGVRLDRDLIADYALVKLLQIIQRRLNRNDLNAARQKASDLRRFA